MVALGIRYLNGWAMAASDGPNKKQAEWPPHPDRVFMALSAAWFETGEDPAEGRALRWLATLGPPAIAASDCSIRSSVVSYVPVNDAKAKTSTSWSEYRKRQARGFPVAIPYDPIVYMAWSEHELGSEYASLLVQLAAKVTHIGHSASLVQMWVAEEEEFVPNWYPRTGRATLHLRVSEAGRLDELKEAYSLSLRPPMTRWQGYERAREDLPPEEPVSLFDPNLIVLAVKRKHTYLPMTLKLTQALHKTLMGACPKQPPPEWLSGHKPNGTPSRDPHMAFLPLPFVGTQHADGRSMGLALALPRSLNPQEVGECLESFLFERDTGLPKRHRLFDGQWLETDIELEVRDQPPNALVPNTWTAASQIWASITPIALDRHFKGKDKWKRVAENVKDGCQRIGLPRPREVILQPVSLVEGVPHVRDFPPLLRKSDGGARSHTHAVIIFDERVRGPIIVGAGRFRGYGFCRPMDR